MQPKEVLVEPEVIAAAIRAVRAQVEQAYRDLTSEDLYEEARYEARCAVIQEIALKVGVALAKHDVTVEIPAFVQQCLRVETLKRGPGRCLNCGSRLVLGMAIMEAVEPDQEPYESGVEETVAHLNVDGEIDLATPILVYAHVCQACGEAFGAWIEGEGPGPNVMLLSNQLAKAEAQLQNVTRTNEKIHDCLKQAISLQAQP